VSVRSYPIAAVDLVVRDLERSVAFYTDHLGLPEATVSADGGAALLTAGPAVLRLREAPDAAGSGWVPDDLQKGFRHIGFTVSDIDARAAALHAQGVRFRMEPKDAYGGVRIAFFYDPDGVLLEFVQGQLSYDRVHDQGLVDEARAVGTPAAPSFDHVAVTVEDLVTTIKTYADGLGFGVAGQLIRADDPRGFVITYLHAGRTVLEVFTYDEAKHDSPWSAQTCTAGFRDVVFTGEVDDIVRRLERAGVRRVADDEALLVDSDGFPLRVETTL
jgi:catechol 2,3-dioxygenase-like lactoylglutathione lyase family enzyme